MRLKLSDVLKRPSSFLFLCLPLLTACAVNPVTGNRDLVLMTENQELEIGKSLHPKIMKQYGGEYDHPAVQAYVSKIGNQLAEKSHRSDLIYHFTVLDTPQVNAFALPGGYIYITRGIMAYMQTEAELAGVLGHEIGHVTARHGVRQHTKGTLASILASVAVSATGNRYAGDLTGVLGTAVIRGYGRDNELEADALGAEYTARIGHDPRKMIDVLEVLKGQEEFEKQLAEEQNREPRVYHGLFSTHPKNDDRLAAVSEVVKALQVSGYRPHEPEAFLKKIEGMVFGSSEKEGIVRGSRFYHQDFGITLEFPDRWLISNQPRYVLGRNASDTAFISFSSEDRNRKGTPRQFLAQKLGKQEADLEGSRLTDSELDGYTTMTRMKTPYGTREARVAVVFSGKTAYLFRAGGRDDEALVSNDASFLRTINSLRPLKESERALAKPARIALLRVESGDTFAALATKSGFSHHAEERLRLLNGMYPDGEPTPGQLLKVVR